jgi:hypothetical protein
VEQAERHRKRDILQLILKFEWDHRAHAVNEGDADQALAQLEELAGHRDIDIETYRYMRGIWQLHFDADQKKQIEAKARKDQYVADYLAFLEAFADAHRFNVDAAGKIQDDFDGRFRLFELTYSQMASGDHGVTVDKRTAHVSTSEPDPAGFYQVCERYDGTYSRAQFFNIVMLTGPHDFNISDGRFVDSFFDELAPFWNFGEIVIHANHEQIEEVEKAYRESMREWPARPEPNKYGVSQGEFAEDRSLRAEAFKAYSKKYDPDYVEDSRSIPF